MTAARVLAKLFVKEGELQEMMVPVPVPDIIRVPIIKESEVYSDGDANTPAPIKYLSFKHTATVVMWWGNYERYELPEDV